MVGWRQVMRKEMTPSMAIRTAAASWRLSIFCISPKVMKAMLRREGGLGGRGGWGLIGREEKGGRGGWLAFGVLLVDTTTSLRGRYCSSSSSYYYYYCSYSLLLSSSHHHHHHHLLLLLLLLLLLQLLTR